jgi:ABC transport system ATP-binding/permease protein
MRLVVTHMQGALAGTRAEFSAPTLRIGRDTTACQLWFDERERGVSRRHAEIALHGATPTVTDLHSAYGTFVNGRRVLDATPLSPGDVIQFGQGGPVIRIEECSPPDPDVPHGDPGQGGITPPPPMQGADASPPETRELFAGPFLELLNGTTVKRFPLLSESASIGRESGNDICLDAETFPLASRRHARIVRRRNEYVVTDLGSFNGTLVDGRLISAPTTLRNGAHLEIGRGGLKLRFVNPSFGVVNEGAGGTVALSESEFVAPSGDARNFLLRKPFAQAKKENVLTLGRADDCDIQLNVLQISNLHARFTVRGDSVTVEDAGSTNGVYCNGKRVARQDVTPGDVIQIGPYLFAADAQSVTVFDTRSRSRIDALDLTKSVRSRAGAGMISLLDRVRLSIPANEFVGLLGPSGAGKSTLMDALNGMRPADSGATLVNGLNLYDNIDSLKQSIGYVPQDDIIHRELTVYRTLLYVAKMRLSADTTREEMEHIISEVLDVTGLTARRDTRISELSGGQRKRVSIAVELVTKPNIIFLDEPTSGLDPATEEKIMHLFRRIADSGHSVIMTTHAMENVRLFDKIAVLMRGRLIWFGPPSEALEHFGIQGVKELFDALGDPNDDAQAERWRQKFERSEAFRKYVVKPLANVERRAARPPRRASNDSSLSQSVRQTATLTQRYFEVLRADRLNLAIMLGQAPVIALLTGLAVESDWTRDFPYFILALSAIWFGCSNAAREIVKEAGVYKRERMTNLGIAPYVCSKLIVLLLIGAVQCLTLYGVTAAVEPTPGDPTLIALCLIASHATGIATGLLISAAVRTSEMATSLVPLVLIPQILFGGLVMPNTGISQLIGAATPAMWSYDLLKRIGLESSEMKTLRGADSEDDPEGELGRIKRRNTDEIEAFKQSLDDYRNRQERRLNDYRRDAEAAQQGRGPAPGALPTLEPAPKAPDVEYPPADKSRFVGFTSNFGALKVDFGMLGIFFLLLILLTLSTLRGKEAR